MTARGWPAVRRPRAHLRERTRHWPGSAPLPRVADGPRSVACRPSGRGIASRRAHVRAPRPLELETLLAGGTIEKRIDENIVLRDLSTRSGAVWSFLLFTGYLNAVEVRVVETNTVARLAIPNLEVAGEIRAMVRDWLEAQVGGSNELRAKRRR
jgi:hypothetical protein